MPAHREFVEETDANIVGMIAGFGAGKTRGLCAKRMRMEIASSSKRNTFSSQQEKAMQEPKSLLPSKKEELALKTMTTPN